MLKHSIKFLLGKLKGFANSARDYWTGSELKSAKNVWNALGDNWCIHVQLRPKKAKNKKANLNKSRQRIEKEHRNIFKETLQPIFSQVSSGCYEMFMISGIW